MTGPEHLLAGKRLLASVDLSTDYGPRAMARVVMAQAHFDAAQVIAFAAVHLPERVSWQQAGDA